MLPQFVYSSKDFVTDVHWGRETNPTAVFPPTNFDTLIRDSWTDRMDRGLFRYHLHDLETQILPGPHGYVAQLNIQRGKERRKPQEILSIQQTFNPKQFNFNQVNPDEVLFSMLKCADGGDKDLAEPCRMAVLINVSPLEFGHVLFVPEPSHCSPQILTQRAVQVGIEAVLLSSDPGFRVGFNSLGAFASVNHLHLHGYYLKCELKIESTPVRPLIPEKHLYRMENCPAGFLFYTEPEELENVARTISRVTDFLVGGNIAHNVFVTRGCPPGGLDVRVRNGVRVAVWPRVSCFGAKEESAFNVALCELAGHLPFKNRKDYESATERSVLGVVQKYLLPDDEFNKLEQQLLDHLQTC